MEKRKIIPVKFKSEIDTILDEIKGGKMIYSILDTIHILFMCFCLLICFLLFVVIFVFILLPLYIIFAIVNLITFIVAELLNL